MNLALLLEAAASRTPSAPALRVRGETLTYAELDALTRKVAGLLARRGVGPGQRVAIWLDKSALAVATMQAALRLGAAYVPIDPLGPAARAAVILADCQVRALVSDGARDTSIAPPGSDVLRCDSPEWRDALHAEPPGDLPRAAPEPDDLAYILYTSGSTGVPKGVCISHRNALAFVHWAADTLAASPADRFANHAPLHFDLSVLDLYVAFRAGACVCMIPDTLAFAAGALADFLIEQEISVWYSVPSALSLMAEHGGLLQRAAPALRAVLLAGEPFPVPLARALRGAWPAVRLLNLYGPTETNVCTYHELAPADLARSAIPIGRACSGDRVFARGEDGHEALAGEEGELCVEGPTVMLGYWGQPAQAGRAYATGDLVRALDDGSYLFCGRKDQLIKLRGYRVEIGEIEAALRAHPALADAGVVVSGAGLQARLVAFLVARGAEQPTLLQIKAHCARQLPRHMIPDRIRHVRALPRTRNGKLDRRALAADIADSEQAGA